MALRQLPSAPQIPSSDSEVKTIRPTEIAWDKDSLREKKWDKELLSEFDNAHYSRTPQTSAETLLKQFDRYNQHLAALNFKLKDFDKDQPGYKALKVYIELTKNRKKEIDDEIDQIKPDLVSQLENQNIQNVSLTAAQKAAMDKIETKIYDLNQTLKLCNRMLYDSDVFDLCIEKEANKSSNKDTLIIRNGVYYIWCYKAGRWQETKLDNSASISLNAGEIVAMSPTKFTTLFKTNPTPRPPAVSFLAWDAHLCKSFRSSHELAKKARDVAKKCVPKKKEEETIQWNKETLYAADLAFRDRIKKIKTDDEWPSVLSNRYNELVSALKFKLECLDLEKGGDSPEYKVLDAYIEVTEARKKEIDRKTKPESSSTGHDPLASERLDISLWDLIYSLADCNRMLYDSQEYSLYPIPKTLFDQYNKKTLKVPCLVKDEEKHTYSFWGHINGQWILSTLPDQNYMQYEAFLDKKCKDTIITSAQHEQFFKDVHSPLKQAENFLKSDTALCHTHHYKGNTIGYSLACIFEFTFFLLAGSTACFISGVTALPAMLALATMVVLTMNAIVAVEFSVKSYHSAVNSYSLWKMNNHREVQSKELHNQFSQGRRP